MKSALHVTLFNCPFVFIQEFEIFRTDIFEGDESVYFGDVNEPFRGFNLPFPSLLLLVPRRRPLLGPLQQCGLIADGTLNTNFSFSSNYRSVRKCDFNFPPHFLLLHLAIRGAQIAIFVDY